jgi:hypothetical protein
MINRAEKIAALLFALFVAYLLKSTILDYATEPKVIGGVDFDKPIPQAVPWTPVYYPMLLSAAFAYWIWPTRSYQSLALKMAVGSFATVRTAYFTLFASFLCSLFGEFYSSLPHLTKMEILLGPVGVFMGALGGTAIFGIFFAMAFILISVVAGCLIVLVGHAASKCLALPSSAYPDEPARLDRAPRSTLSRSRTNGLG